MHAHGRTCLHGKLQGNHTDHRARNRLTRNNHPTNSKTQHTTSTSTSASTSASTMDDSKPEPHSVADERAYERAVAADYTAELTNAVRASNLEKAWVDPPKRRAAATAGDSPRTTANRAAAVARALGPSPSMPAGRHHAAYDYTKESDSAELLELQLAMQRDIQKWGETAYDADVMDAHTSSTDAGWTAAFEAASEAVDPSMSPQESALVLQGLIKQNLLTYTDIRDNPQRFFLAHRLLSKRLVGGFGIRFTVQFNLFAGSILGLGSDEQIAQLAELQEQATLGCFALTEAGAGVNSGLVVNTTATWDSTSKSFVLNTPDELARKQWISQGMTATSMVVIADLIVNGESHGPHAFLMPLRDEATGELTRGVTVGDMGNKTIANDLDNAWIAFDQVTIPRACMLDRFATIENGQDFDCSDQYMSRGGETMRLEVIGQRLLTGRMCISQAGLVFARTLFAKTRAYSDNKSVWSPTDSNLKLSDVPQLAALYKRADDELGRMEEFVTAIEAQLCVCLSESTIPSPELVEAIAVCKIRGVGAATELCFALQQEVGSFALLGGGGFEHLDMLLCCKFAEGDERILMQKMARDRLKTVENGMAGGVGGWVELGAELLSEAPRRKEALKALQLALAMKTNTRSGHDDHSADDVAAMLSLQRPMHMGLGPHMGGISAATAAALSNYEKSTEGEAAKAARRQAEKAAMVAAWTDSWEEVYGLAAAICDRHIAEVTGMKQHDRAVTRSNL